MLHFTKQHRQVNVNTQLTIMSLAAFSFGSYRTAVPSSGLPVVVRSKNFKNRFS